MKKILVIHGPNLNLLGEREPDVYGRVTMEVINQRLVEAGNKAGFEVVTFQSNHEGALVDQIQEARKYAAGIVINPGGYTHTSVAIRDAIAGIHIPVVEVHMSNVQAREEFRHHSFISPVCLGTIVGFGWRSYLLGLNALIGVVQDRRIGEA